MNQGNQQLINLLISIQLLYLYEHNIFIISNIKQKMEDYITKRLSIQTMLKPHSQIIPHHTSVTYQPSFYTKHPIFRRINRSQISKIQTMNKQQIFQLVYRFIGKLIINSNQLSLIFYQMKFQNNHHSIININQSSYLNSQEQVSENSIQSKQNINNQKNLQQNILQQKQQNISQHTNQTKYKNRTAKISIMLQSISDFSSQSYLSTNSIENIKITQFPSRILTLQIIRQIFQQPQPFLINLAMCLMLKFLFFCKININGTNACWILSISTIIAYKIYYDQPVEGLIDSFSNILDVKRQQIINMQRYFLSQISFQAIITNQQYHVMLTKILN